MEDTINFDVLLTSKGLQSSGDKPHKEIIYLVEIYKIAVKSS